jgi:hypothetical protein
MEGMGTGESAREHRERLRAHGKPMGAMTARPVRLAIPGFPDGPPGSCGSPTLFVRTSSPVRDSRFGSWSGARGGNNRADHRPADRE